MLFELARHSGLDGEMARIVRPRRDLVDEQRVVVGVTKNSTQVTPTTFSAIKHAVRNLGRLAGDVCGTRAGESEISRIWLTWMFSMAPKSADVSVHTARRHDRNLLVELNPHLGDGGWTSHRCPTRRSVRAAPAATAWPFPSYPEEAVFSTIGKPSCAAAMAKSASDRTGTKGVTGRPASRRAVFSRMRFWAVRRTQPPG